MVAGEVERLDVSCESDGNISEQPKRLSGVPNQKNTVDSVHFAAFRLSALRAGNGRSPAVSDTTGHARVIVCYPNHGSGISGAESLQHIRTTYSFARHSEERATRS